MGTRRGIARLLALAGTLLCCARAANAAPPPDWSAVPVVKIAIFHPGQASWEWMLTESDHSGGPKLRQGKTCIECHAGEEEKIGETLGSGAKAEPHPVAAGQRSASVDVQFARDDEKLYARLSWPAATGSAKSRVSLLLDDGSVKEATRAGCWATCHGDLEDMAHAEARGERSKYLVQSRLKMQRTGGGDATKPAAELESLAKSGVFLELWQAHLANGKAAEAREGWVLERRHEEDAVELAAVGSLAAGRWTVVLSRTLRPKSAHHKVLEPGRTYSFGISVHEGEAEHREHLVSFEHTLALDSGSAEFIAKRP